MFAITLLSIKRMKEPAFFIFLSITLVISYFMADLDPLTQQVSGDSIFAQVLDAGRSSQPLLSASFVMFIVCAVLGGFLGASEIPRDISSDLILIILSKPIKKIDYMLGKYFGMLIVCACLFVISEAVIYVTHYINTKELYSMMLMLKQLYLLLAFIPYCAMIIMISCFTGELAAMIVSFFYLVIQLHSDCHGNASERDCGRSRRRHFRPVLFLPEFYLLFSGFQDVRTGLHHAADLFFQSCGNLSCRRCRQT